jgi:putative ABC transport system permease protein
LTVTSGYFEPLLQDIGYSVRVLRRSPLFTVIATVSLALGIGVNAVVFSVVNAVLVRPLPYPQPDRIVRIGGFGPQEAASVPEYDFWKAHSQSFGSMAAYRGISERRVALGSGQEFVKTLAVSMDFLRVLGVNAAQGREFIAEETRPGAPRAIVISDAVWRRFFAADPAVLGRAITLDDTAFTVVGILPGTYWFPEKADALIPLRPTGEMADMGRNTQVIGRLKTGVSLEQARAEMATLSDQFKRAFPGLATGKYRGLTAESFHDSLVGDVRVKLLLLFGATGLLLLIACSNLLSLFLTRLTARRKEIAVRLALGASAGQLLRQLLIENLLLATAGSAAGLFGTAILLKGLLALIPFHLPSSAPIGLDPTVLGFAVATAFSTAILFTIVPAISTARLHVQEALKSVGRTAGIGQTPRRTRNLLVVVEVALSATLLTTAGLLIQSLYRMQQVKLGFSPHGVVTFQTPLAADRHGNADDLARFVGTMSARLQRVPGATRVAAINVLPLGGRSNLPAQREGHPENSIGGMEIRLVTPEYFSTLQIALRQGRLFDENDRRQAPPSALINEALARKWWPRGNALGDRVVIGRFQGKDYPEIKDSPREVIGIVADTKTTNLKDNALPTVYVCILQASDVLAEVTYDLSWVVSVNNIATAANDVRRGVAELDPHQRVRQVRTMDDIVSSITASSRFNAWLFGIFAGVALALAATGVYGLVSFSVAQRKHEFGTRMVLGAGRGHVMRLVLAQGLFLAFCGVAIGMGGALLATRALTAMLFGIRPTDPLSFVAVAVALIVVALGASFVPAHAATRIEPMDAIRYE